MQKYMFVSDFPTDSLRTTPTQQILSQIQQNKIYSLVADPLFIQVFDGN